MKRRIIMMMFTGMLFVQKSNAQYPYFSSAGPTMYTYTIKNAEGKINKFYETDYLPGSAIISPNRKYIAIMQFDGYFVLYENTPYGPIVRWKFPDKQTPTPFSGLKFVEGICQFGPSTHYAYITISNPAVIGSYFNMVTFNKNNGGITMALSDDGQILVQNVGSTDPPGWTSNTSEYGGSGGAKIRPSYTRDGNDFIIDPLFNDEFYTQYFAMGKILFPGTLVFQRKNLVKFTADTYIELLPGFITDITGNGGLSLEYLKHITSNGASPGEANSTNNYTNNLSGNIAANSSSQNNKSNAGLPTENGVAKFNLSPNPTSGIVNIKLSNPEDRVQYAKVFDSNGRLVATYGAVTTINITKLTQGLYYYNIYTVKEGMHTGKLIKL